jgi:putative transposase
MFELFDPKQDFVVRHGNLPHWYQPGVTYFVTFRTADSVPQGLLNQWHDAQERWLREHGIDPAHTDWRKHLRGKPDLEVEFSLRFSKDFMAYLDRGYGSCPLREPRVSQIVANALRHFDGKRYHLGDFVVMPNHVHLLAGLLSDVEIEAQCQSWKKFSAIQINRLLNQTGRFWQAESFDHLVRSPEQFERFRRYIAANPAKARLKTGEYYCWRRPD